MLAERATIQTDAEGNPAGLPKLPPNSRFEVIFLFLDQAVNSQLQQSAILLPDNPSGGWKVSTKIAGKGKILGDIVAPVIPENDWEAIR